MEVTEDDGGGGQPISDPKRREVGNEVEVAVSEFPVGVRVAGNRLHLHVRGEEIVAAVTPAFCNLFDEEVAVDPFAVEPAVVVGECHDDRIDCTGLDGRGQLIRASGFRATSS